jgi:hypothetical protein
MIRDNNAWDDAAITRSAKNAARYIRFAAEDIGQMRTAPRRSECRR